MDGFGGGGGLKCCVAAFIFCSFRMRPGGTCKIAASVALAEDDIQFNSIMWVKLNIITVKK